MNKILEAHLKTLIEYQEHVFNVGHDFWFCDAQDASHNKPFYYYQINRCEDMATCSNCQKLMELRRQIRSIEKLLNKPLTPLYTNFKQKEHVKRISVSNKSDFNPTYQYL